MGMEQPTRSRAPSHYHTYRRPAWILILAVVLVQFSFVVVPVQGQRQQQQQQQQQQEKEKPPPPEPKQLTPKTECLATDEDFSTYHCISLEEEPRIKCLDAEEPECEHWASKGECQNNPQYMLVQCRKSCQSCIGLHQGGVQQIATKAQLRPQILKKLVDTQEYQHKQASESFHSLTNCVNRHELCTQWSLQGECETNPHFMQHECNAACRTC